MFVSAFKHKNYTSFVDRKSCLPFIVMPDAINAIVTIMHCKKNRLTKNIYNITSFSPTVIDFYNQLKREFPKFLIDYNIDKKRQDIIDSWPNFIDDTNAKNDWGWSPKYDFNLAFNKYITPELKKLY